MGTYLQVFSIGIQNTLVYRVNFLFRAAFGLIPLAATLQVWRALYGGKPAGDLVSGYTLAEMTTYYLVVTVVDALTAVNEDDWQIAAEIKDGMVSQFLVKPIDYLGYRLTLFLAGRVTYTSVAVLPVACFGVWLRDSVVLPVDVPGLLLGGLSVMMTGLLQFLLSYTMALLAFWVAEVSTLIFILFAFEYIASGHLFPLNVLPGWIEWLLRLTPFPYQMYFPATVLMGKVRGPELWGGLAMQAAWVGTAFLLARWVWRRGVRRYSAVGG